jgi:hypothetical protein
MFDANFDTEHTQRIELWINDNTHVVRKKDATEFKKILRKSTLMKDLVQLLSWSKRIIDWDFRLELEVMLSLDLMLQEMGEKSHDELDEQIDVVTEAANERATEIFLDSGICEHCRD